MKSLQTPECIVRDRRRREQSVKPRERCPRVKRVARMKRRAQLAARKTLAAKTTREGLIYFANPLEDELPERLRLRLDLRPLGVAVRRVHVHEVLLLVAEGLFQLALLEVREVDVQ